jgi:hypothetical protein
MKVPLPIRAAPGQSPETFLEGRLQSKKPPEKAAAAKDWLPHH